MYQSWVHTRFILHLVDDRKCISVHEYTSTLAYMHTYLYACTYIYICTYKCMCTPLRINLYIPTYTRIYTVHLHPNFYTCTHIYIFEYTDANTQIYTRIHLQICICLCMQYSSAHMRIYMNTKVRPAFLAAKHATPDRTSRWCAGHLFVWLRVTN